MFRLRLLLSGLGLVFVSSASAQSVGTSFCNTTNNSTGGPTVLTGAAGSGIGSDLHLEVSNGVPGEIGYVLAGNEATGGMMISNGLLCLVGSGTASLYRYNVGGAGSNSVGQFDAAGVLQNLAGTSSSGSGFDVPSTIPDSVPIIIMSGDTWHFQVWHRDTPAGAGSSNFSNGLSVTFPLGGTVPVAGMVLIPAGSFMMGSDAPAGAPYFGGTYLQPVHDVTISEDFWMGEHEVTQAEYQSVMGVNPSLFTGTTRPVEQVSWNDARAYCAALTAQEVAAGNVPAGYEYRLPTEAEWEYSCRAGTTTEFYFGTDLFCADARFWFSNHSNLSCGVNASAGTVGVGGYPANAFGLHDMHGNVWEWCLDSYTPYLPGSATDPFFSVGGNRILRGGSWFYDSYVSKSANRSEYGPSSFHSSVGFRVVLAEIVVP